MEPLDALVRQAQALAAGGTGTPSALEAAESEVARQLQICNACRYCEGFCAVFPAMTRRLEFHAADTHFLAHLCHNCGACLHACQYAPPHAFGLNLPQAMATLRGQTYAHYAWPAAWGRLYQRSGVTLALALVASLGLLLALALGASGGAQSVLAHGALVALFAPVFVAVVLALGLSVRSFWRTITPATSGAPVTPDAAREATRDTLTLRYLGGGHGEGCNNQDDAWTLWRRRAHHLTFYGFALCFAATAVATMYHYLLGWGAPYDWPSLPKLLGTLGGASLLAGTVGLFMLNLQRHPLHGDAAQKPMDRGFMALLVLTSASGFAAWLSRGTHLLPWALGVHLGAVMALFITLPYGKFVHGLYRVAALLRHAVEKRQPNHLRLGDD